MQDITSLENMRRYFSSGATLAYKFRKEQLIKLKKSILKYENELYSALMVDLKKSKEETWITEIGMVVAEINNAIRYLANWMEPERVSTTLVNMPSTSKIVKEPLGVVLIIGPWNYPFQLLINPLVGAIAAGNCVVVKPSEIAITCAEVINKIIDETFLPQYICCIQGDGAAILPTMMNNFRFDHVFFTGSTAVGKSIYKMAAERMVPVTLELGGKSPCVVEADANIKVAARRIAVTKFSNTGQMCVAPDYVLVHSSIKDKFIEALKATALKFYGTNALESYDFGKIINEKQFDRLVKYLKTGEIAYGGKNNRKELFIEPTILADVDINAPVMSEEIFGPILPVITFNTMEEAKAIIDRNPNPLAFYLFTASKKNETKWIEAIPAGGACINNCSWHLTNHHLPFGGRGFSGMGAYHGKFSFDTFTHKKAIMKTPTWFDPAIKYPPQKGKLRLFKWVVK